MIQQVQGACRHKADTYEAVAKRPNEVSDSSEKRGVYRGKSGSSVDYAKSREEVSTSHARMISQRSECTSIRPPEGRKQITTAGVAGPLTPIGGVRMLSTQFRTGLRGRFLGPEVTATCARSSSRKIRVRMRVAAKGRKQFLGDNMSHLFFQERWRMHAGSKS